MGGKPREASDSRVESSTVSKPYQDGEWPQNRYIFTGSDNAVFVTVKIISLEKWGWKKPDWSGLESDLETESRNGCLQLIFLKNVSLWRGAGEVGGSYKRIWITRVCFIFPYWEELEQVYVLCDWAKAEELDDDLGKSRLAEEGRPWGDEEGWEVGHKTHMWGEGVCLWKAVASIGTHMAHTWAITQHTAVEGYDWNGKETISGGE